MRVVVYLLILLLAGCASLSETEKKKAEAAGCATALFLGRMVGLPLAVACAVRDVDDEDDKDKKGKKGARKAD